MAIHKPKTANLEQVDSSQISLFNVALISFSILFGITILAGTICTNIHTVNADTDVTDDVSITVSSVCNLTSNVGTEHTANITPGLAFTENIGLTNVMASCNDSAGYSIYAVGYSGTPSTIGNTNLIDSTNNTTIATHDYSASYTSDSYWSMKLTAGTGADAATIITTPTDYSTYVAVPDAYDKVATKLSATTGTGLAAFTTTYGAYATTTQTAGTYTGKVKYTLVHPNNAPEPPRAPVSCPTKVPNLTYMQDLNSSNKASVLASMTEDEQYYLADGRDNKSYCVAKLKDGNIWMTQNLDLDLDSTKTYTPQDTDIPSNWRPVISTYPTGTTTWNSPATTPESYNPGERYWNPNYDDETALADEYYDSCINGTCDMSIYEQLSSDWKAFYDSCDTGTVNNCDQSLLPSPAPSTGDSHYHLGNFYNWTAAVAMNDSSSYTTDNQDANQSICPANWTLPKGGNNTSSGSFYYLISQYGWDSSSRKMENPTIWNSPIKIPLNGIWQGTEQGWGVGSEGYFWSSMTINNQVAYELVVHKNYIDPTTGTWRRYGQSIRCLAR